MSHDTTNWSVIATFIMYISGTMQVNMLIEQTTYQHLLLLCERHQRRRPAHKSCNLTRAVWLILSMQYQQKPSADTVKNQCTARCQPRSNNKPFNVGEFVLYEIYGTRVVVSWRDKVLSFTSCCISHSTTPLCHKSRNALLTNIKLYINEWCRIQTWSFKNSNKMYYTTHMTTPL